ncbi:MAG: diguanylate cyclase [Nostocales cyanobacterium]|nr:MAG: diguanylate cyclase [Nostocales cyanobacterium]TAF18678.1 MAG: diguanylate cyclase [Nostocales cyanobacterium]
MLLSISKYKPRLDKNNTLILLVDRSLENLHLLANFLEKQGFKVKKAINGKKAIDIAKKRTPDLIILDINIPEINGYPVYQHLKCDTKTVNVPIIFMGTEQEIAEKVRSFELTITDCITKPFQEDQVLTQVRSKLVINNNNQPLNKHNQPLTKEMDEHIKFTNTLVSANQNLQTVITFDPVTKVANRKTFNEYLNSQWKKLEKKQIPLSLLLCNFDFYEKIDNSLKDQILKELAQNIKSVVKRSTDLFARYDNNKLAVILPSTDSKGAVYLGKLIREQVEKVKINYPQLQGDKNFNLNIGVATIVPSEKMTPQSLIELVEQAIRKAKASGKS